MDMEFLSKAMNMAAAGKSDEEAAKELGIAGPDGKTDLNMFLAAMCNQKVDPSMGKTPLEEVEPGSMNGHPTLYHRLPPPANHGCGGMIPATDGEWICHSCNTYITKEDAELKLQEARNGWKGIIERLSE